MPKRRQDMKSMNRRRFMRDLGVFAAGSMVAGSLLNRCAGGKGQKPNFVILFTDDMGYGDWNRGGHPTIHTPNLNKMADEGIQLTQFYSANPVCSPSRSALLTGRNPIRTGVVHVFCPNDGNGIPETEITIAEALKPLGYTSACIGKWHLGDSKPFLPTDRGFDYYYGIPYSNDMRIELDDKVGPPIMRNEEIVEHPADQTTLTKRYTEEAIKFIEENKDQPFFLYLPYTMPHRPLFASEDFLDTSRRGLYGDTIEEIDWSVGMVNDTLNRLGLSKNTLVIFTSDNGPWASMRLRGGVAGTLRGAKGDTWEGGMREPFVARWPGRIPAGTISYSVGSTLDFFPTIVKLAGGEIPDDRAIDGMDFMTVLEGNEGVERTIFYYYFDYFCAMRKGQWKIHFRYYDLPTDANYKYNLNRHWVNPKKPLLYNLESDPSEKYDVADRFPGVMKEMMKVADRHRQEIKQRGENVDLIEWFKDPSRIRRAGK